MHRAARVIYKPQFDNTWWFISSFIERSSRNVNICKKVLLYWQENLVEEDEKHTVWKTHKSVKRVTWSKVVRCNENKEEKAEKRVVAIVVAQLCRLRDTQHTRRYNIWNQFPRIPMRRRRAAPWPRAPDVALRAGHKRSNYGLLCYRRTLAIVYDLDPDLHLSIFIRGASLSIYASRAKRATLIAIGDSHARLSRLRRHSWETPAGNITLLSQKCGERSIKYK